MSDTEFLNFILDKNGNINANLSLNKILSNNKYIEYKNFILSRYNDIPKNKLTISEIVYRIQNNIEIRPVCEKCGNPVNFIGRSKGYCKTCSVSCGILNPNRKEKYKKHV